MKGDLYSAAIFDCIEKKKQNNLQALSPQCSRLAAQHELWQQDRVAIPQVKRSHNTASGLDVAGNRESRSPCG